MSRFTIDQTALLKILLHSLKYPTTGVNGILIGEDRTVQATDASSPAQRVLHIYDVVPVCHTHITLAPVLEAALAQTAAYVKQQGGKLRVAGYYQCNERLDDLDLGLVGRRIADKVDNLFPGSAAIVLDGPALRAALAGSGAKPPVLLLGKDARGWVTAAASGPGARFICPSVTTLLAQYVEEGRHRRLSDFEDHLEDLQGADWLNPGLCD